MRNGVERESRSERRSMSSGNNVKISESTRGRLGSRGRSRSGNGREIGSRSRNGSRSRRRDTSARTRTRTSGSGNRGRSYSRGRSDSRGRGRSRSRGPTTSMSMGTSGSGSRGGNGRGSTSGGTRRQDRVEGRSRWGCLVSGIGLRANYINECVKGALEERTSDIGIIGMDGVGRTLALGAKSVNGLPRTYNRRFVQ